MFLSQGNSTKSDAFANCQGLGPSRGRIWGAHLWRWRAVHLPRPQGFSHKTSLPKSDLPRVVTIPSGWESKGWEGTRAVRWLKVNFDSSQEPILFQSRFPFSSNPGDTDYGHALWWRGRLSHFLLATAFVSFLQKILHWINISMWVMELVIETSCQHVILVLSLPWAGLHCGGQEHNLLAPHSSKVFSNQTKRAFDQSVPQVRGWWSSLLHM